MLAVLLCACSMNSGTETQDASMPADSGTARYEDAGTDSSPDTGSMECDLVLQNCEDGEKCTGIRDYFSDPYSGTVCVPGNADAGAPPGMICINGIEGRDTCGPDSMCVQFGTGEGACYRFCRQGGTRPECPDGFNCATLNLEFGIRLCFQDCNPLMQDCPYETRIYGCYPEDGAFSCLSYRPDGTLTYGDECVDNVDCSPGHWCASKNHVPGCESDTGCCSVFCDTEKENDCPSAAQGQECVPVFNASQAPEGKENTGLCMMENQESSG